MKDLRGKNAVVTGAAMGIGFDTCKRLVNEGCTVTMWDMNEEGIENAKKELGRNGATVYGYTCDVTDKKMVSQLADKAISDMGQVDILINNAGYVRSGMFCDIPIEQLERQTDVNLTSLYYTIQAFLPAMYERNLGHIVNISSVAGLIGIPSLHVYCATKWGVWGLTESLRFEAQALKKDGVKHSSIHPFFIKTGMFEGGTVKHPLLKLFFPPIKSHDVIAKAIVEKALKKERNVVKVPGFFHSLVLMRALLPDKLIGPLTSRFGIANVMDDWTGRPGSEHAGT